MDFDKNDPVFIAGYDAGLHDKMLGAVDDEELRRSMSAVENLQRQAEQERQAFHHLSDMLSASRQRNRALRDHLCDLIEENKRLRLALANAQHGDV